eukprot:CAMPEP_0202730050 /NCGR_PEP_ID=MMETSP1385-20130828/186444_1 /ASSEMBLY_ACC=CAM_ASM_000861 /TAXON_ID=933848 /ORGANISM="Elphidium margaritaceum" /LENGTH=358 /DNA_ID=CAMNT_0049396323 /DNA_START=31 /DNA_END=1107 /DNA_ORIENTATION=-
MAEASQSPQSSKANKQSDASAADKLTVLFAKLQPVISFLVDAYVKLSPYLEIARTYIAKGWQHIEPYYRRYWKTEYIEIFIGFVLLFFGGTFAMTIACYMAVQLSGLDTMKQAWATLKRNYRDGVEAFQNDPNARKFFDQDGDGQVSAKEFGSVTQRLFTGSAADKQAVLMHLRCVFVAVDPNQVMNGIGGIWTTAVAVIATLRSQFAKDIALGVSIGEMVSRQIGKYVKPVLAKRFDDDMKKWADFLVDAFCRFFGISLALILVRVVSAFHSAVKGGQIIARFVFQFLDNKQLSVPTAGTEYSIESTTVYMVVQYGLAAMGFYWQIQSGFVLNSIVLRLLVLPFSICELILTYLAAY